MGALDLAPLVARFNVGPLTLLRAVSPEQNEAGGFDDAAESALSLDPVSIHQLDGRELQQLPESERLRHMIKLYTTQRLYAGDGGQAADKVVYQGDTYRVLRVYDEADNGGVWRAIAGLEAP